MNLTGGVGDAQQIVFRLVRLDRAGGGGRGGRGGGGLGASGTDEDEGIDLSKPLTLSAYGERTKKSGYYTLAPGAKPAPLVYEDASVGGAVKAEKADRVIFTKQTSASSRTTGSQHVVLVAEQGDGRQSVLDEYAWGSKVLVDYTNSKGQRLQGTLMLPADYEPGKKYPMLVEFYEIMSNTHHNFSIPGYSNSPQLSTYASNGYLVFQPDIVYEIGTPGTSAVDCMTSAVKKVIELGYADPKHIGLHGHSWSGYQIELHRDADGHVRRRRHRRAADEPHQLL